MFKLVLASDDYWIVAPLAVPFLCMIQINKISGTARGIGGIRILARAMAK